MNEGYDSGGVWVWSQKEDSAVPRSEKIIVRLVAEVTQETISR